MAPQLSKLVLIRDTYAYPKQVASTVINVRGLLSLLRWLLASTKALPAESLGSKAEVQAVVRLFVLKLVPSAFGSLV